MEKIISENIQEEDKKSTNQNEKKQQKLQKKRAIAENSNLLVDKKDINAALKKQIEFYFSDSNLYHDNYLYNLLHQSGKKYEVDSKIILNFSRIKQIFGSEYTDQTKQLEIIKNALAGSSVVNLSEDLKNFKRKQPFSRENYEKSNEVDKRSIYVENLPSTITHESLAAIFAKIGKIMHISLPKFSNSKLPKGFAFIEFCSSEIAEEAVKKLNGMIPAEFMDPEISHYVPSTGIFYNFIKNIGTVQALRVMPVSEWLSYKKEYKKIMKEIEELKNIAPHDSTSENPVKPESENKDFLVRIEGLQENTTKANIRIFVAHFAKCEYVDYKRGNSYAILRFSDKKEMNEFLEGCKNTEKVLTLGKTAIKATLLSPEEESEYKKQVEKSKQEFKEYLNEKRRKKKKYNDEEEY